MQEHSELSPADREVEDLLRSLTASRVQIDPVAAAFVAGRRSSQRQVRAWRSASTLLLALGIGAWLLPPGSDGSGGAFQQPEFAVTPVRAAGGDVFRSQSLANLQYAVREHGIDGLPNTQIPTVQNLRSQDLL